MFKKLCTLIFVIIFPVMALAQNYGKIMGKVVSSAAIDADEAIYFGSHDRKLYALRADGTKAWDFTTGGPILSSPAVDKDGTIYFTSIDGLFYALASDGKLKWKLRTGGISESSPVISPEGVLYVGVNTNLWAISRDGKKIWERADEGVLDSAPFVLADTSVAWISRYGALFNIEPDRRFKAMRPFLWGGYASPGISPAGTVYLPAFWTNFSALRSDLPLARSPWPRFRGNARNTGNVADILRE